MDPPASKWQPVPTSILPPLFKREDLTDEQEAKFKAFKTGRAKEYIKKQHDLDLLRWLLARQWDVEKATDMFINSMKWREEQEVDTILETFPKTPWFKFIVAHFPSSHTDPKCKELFTKDGHNLVFEKIGLIDPESTALYPVEDLIRFHIYAMELGNVRRWRIFEELGSNAIPTTTVIEDLSGLGLSHLNTTLLGILREWTQIDSDNYPESLRKVYLTNLPSIFSIIWKMVQYIWDENQKAKFQFVAAGTDTADIFKQFTFAEDLPIPYGGDYSYTFPEKKDYKYFKKLFDSVKLKWEKEHVSRSGVFELPFKLDKDQTLTWEFKTKDYDISFGVFYRDANNKETAHIESTRVNSQTKTITGTLLVDKPGLYILRWDNSYSWTRGKDLLYVTKVGPDPEPMSLGDVITSDADAGAAPTIVPKKKKKDKSDKKSKALVPGKSDKSGSSRSDKSDKSERSEKSDKSRSEKSRSERSTEKSDNST